MHRLFIGLVFAAMIQAQAPAPRPFKVIRLDRALDAIITTDAKIEILGEHFGLTEGPVWIQDPAGGYLLSASRFWCIWKKADTRARTR